MAYIKKWVIIALINDWQFWIRVQCDQSNSNTIKQACSEWQCLQILQSSYYELNPSIELSEKHWSFVNFEDWHVQIFKGC
jgi:hypothetical protein